MGHYSKNKNMEKGDCNQKMLIKVGLICKNYRHISSDKVAEISDRCGTFNTLCQYENSQLIISKMRNVEELMKYSIHFSMAFCCARPYD